jgi:hypothetical protein
MHTMQIATIKLALTSKDNAGRPYAMLFRQTIDMDNGRKCALKCKIVNCRTIEEADAIAASHRGASASILPH